MSGEIILVNLNNHQSYIIENIKNLLLFNNKKITVITNKELFSEFKSLEGKIKIVDEKELDLSYFDVRNKQKTSFRNGFWPLTSRRLFCVYEYIKKNGLKDSFHLENDVMVYSDLSKMVKTLKKDKLYVTMDAPNRCIAGILFIPTAYNMVPLIENYEFHKNDMLNLVKFYIKNRNFCETFPIIKANGCYKMELDDLCKNFDELQGIFDAAAIGQYLGGVDPRNKRGDTRGFINETCKVNYSKYKFYWKKNKTEMLYRPYIEIDGKSIPIFNLHIHCKNLKNFMGDNPLEKKLIELIR
jgi:hypothetical protein